jgi:hypothetical protein
MGVRYLYTNGCMPMSDGEDDAQGPVPPRNYTDHNVTDIIHAHCNYFKHHQGCIRRVVNAL